MSTLTAALPRSRTDNTGAAAASALLDPITRFVTALPYTTLAADVLSDGAKRMDREWALQHREIRPDPIGWLTALRFDLDCGCHGKPHARKDSRYKCPSAVDAWMDAEMPAPNLIIRRKSNGHCHYVYQLASWVDHSHKRASTKARLVRRAMTEAIGADPAYAGTFTHNPKHPDFEVLTPRSQPYTLDELATYVDTVEPLYAEKKKPNSIALGRNCEAFDTVRLWAYAAVDRFRCSGPSEDFHAAVYERTASVNKHFPIPMDDYEVRSIAHSIARWTWNVYVSASAETAQRRLEASRERDAQRKADRAARKRSRTDLAEAALERRRLVIGHFKLGVALTTIADRVRISIRTVQRILQSLATHAPTASGNSSAPPSPGVKPAVSKAPMRLVQMLERRSTAAASAFMDAYRQTQMLAKAVNDHLKKQISRS